MAKIVECVPNFSEGRRADVLDRIVKAMTDVDGVQLLDREMDADHNRAVVSLIGPPDAVSEGVFQGMKTAAELINLDEHIGEHPRMGATDVVPFIPITEMTMDECVTLARELGRRVGDELGIPVYLYEKAATRPDRENLAEVRRGQYEGMKEQIEKNADRAPDFGPCKMGTAGATAIGARMPLVAYNVYLDTDDIKIANKIAKAVRSRSGGYRDVKALGFEIRDRGCVQISMNLVNYKGSPIHRVFETIKSEAERWGTRVVSSEVVGLVPTEALSRVAEHYLRIENFDVGQILEMKMMGMGMKSEVGVGKFLDTVASRKPAPGGGSVSSLLGALASALASMVVRLTYKKRKFADVKEELTEVLTNSESKRRELTDLIKTDAEAFDAVMAAFKMHEDNDEEKAAKAAAVQEATVGATQVPLTVMRTASDVLPLLRTVAERGNPNSVSDAGVGALAAKAAIQGARLNVDINLPGIEDAKVRNELTKEADKIEKTALPEADAIVGIVKKKIAGKK
jgi:glutamate formiminotransferase/formiminotetrahydrofolate cyclodeaminase